MGQRAKYTNLSYTGSCYKPSPTVLKAINKEAINSNSYPYEGYSELEKAIAKYAGVKPENIAVTNGCDEAISLITYLFGKRVLIQAPTYSEFERIAKGINAEIRIKQQSILKSKYDISFSKQDLGWASLVWICSPNNPTGDVVPKEKILSMIKEAKGIVAVDEAYYEYCNESVAGLVNKEDNLIVTRTFSKAFATEGIRLGYIIANPEMIRMIKLSTQEFNVNRFARAAGIAVFKNMDYYKKEMKKLLSIKMRFEQTCSSMGIKILGHNLPFTLIAFDSEKERDIFYNKLRDNSIITLKNTHEEFSGFVDPAIRIAIGTSEEMDRVINIINKVA